MTLPAEVVQLVEQLAVNPNLEGLNPYPAGIWVNLHQDKKSINLTLPAEVAQRQEQLTHNFKLEGLNPVATRT